MAATLASNSENFEARPTFKFSVRELTYFVAFLCVVFALSTGAQGAFPIVLINGIILSLIALRRGAWLYPWIIFGALATHATWWFLFIYADGNPNFIDTSDLKSISTVLLAIGATIGAAIGVGSRRQSSTIIMIALLITIVDWIWLMFSVQ